MRHFNSQESHFAANQSFYSNFAQIKCQILYIAQNLVKSCVSNQFNIIIKMFKGILVPFQRRVVAYAAFSAAPQTPQTEKNVKIDSLAIRAFLSWTVLWRINNLKKQNIYKDCKNSYRKQLITEVTGLKYQQGSEITFQPQNLKQNSKKVQTPQQVVKQFMSAYQVGKGIQVDKFYQREMLQLKQGVLNPTTITKRFLATIKFKSTQVNIGNKGIGKTFSLLNFQYLSFWRFEYLYHGNNMEKIKKLTEINNHFFSGKPALSYIKSFKKLPLFVYFQSTPDLKWADFYQNLTRQFPYISVSQSVRKRKQDDDLDQEQRIFREKSQKFCSKLDFFLRVLKNQGFETFIVIDQANNYLKLLNSYYFQCQDPKTFQPDLTKLRKKIQQMSDQIELLKSMTAARITYFFSEQAQLDIFNKPKARCFFAGFTQLVNNSVQLRNQFKTNYGNSDFDEYLQNEIFTFLELLTMENLLFMYKSIEEEINHEDLQKYLEVVQKELGIHEILHQLRKDKFFKFNTTFLTLSQFLFRKNQEQIDQGIDEDNTKKTDEKMDTQIELPSGTKMIRTVKFFKEAFERLKEHAAKNNKNQSDLAQVKNLCRKFLTYVIDQCNDQSHTQHKDRILKKFNQVQTNQIQKERIIQFYKALYTVLQRQMNQDRRNMMNQLKKQSIVSTFQQTKASETTQIFNGNFEGCTLSGYIDVRTSDPKQEAPSDPKQEPTSDQKQKAASELKTGTNIEHKTETNIEPKTGSSIEPKTGSSIEPKKGPKQEGKQGGLMVGQFVNGYIISGQFLKKGQKIPIFYPEDASKTSTNSDDQKKQNYQIRSQEGVLKNGVFIGEFKGKVTNGTLIGTMEGKLTGHKIKAETMRSYWQKKKKIILSQEQTSYVFSKILSENQFNQIQQKKTLNLKEITSVQQLTHKSLLRVLSQNRIELNLPKHKMVDLIFDTFKIASVERNISLFRQQTEQKPHKIFDQIMTIGLSQNKGVLSLKNSQSLKIKLVNPLPLGFYHFNVKLGQQQRFNVISQGKYGQFDIRKLKVGQGVGYRPLGQTKNEYSVISKGIDTLFIFRSQKQKFRLITFDYTLGQNSVSIYKDKLKTNTSIYDTFIAKENYFNLSFKDTYTHYILVLDGQYQQIIESKSLPPMLSYQKIVRASDLEFEPYGLTKYQQYLPRSIERMLATIDNLKKYNEKLPKK